MSQRVTTDDVLAAELARCERILKGLYREVKTFRPEGKHFYFAVTTPTDADLQGFYTPSLRMSYLASQLGAKKGATLVEEPENTAHLVIKAAGYQVTYHVHITFGEYLRERA